MCIEASIDRLASSQDSQKSPETKALIRISPQLYKLIGLEFWFRSNSVNLRPCHFHNSAIQACVQIVHKPAKVVQILVDGWKCKTISVKSFFQYIAKQAMTAKCCQTNLNDISFDAQTMP